jgi:hypothetical protein
MVMIQQTAVFRWLTVLMCTGNSARRRFPVADERGFSFVREVRTQTAAGRAYL